MTFAKTALVAAAGAAIVAHTDAFAPSSAAGLRLRSGASAISSTPAPRAVSRCAVAGAVMEGELAAKYGHLRGADVEPCGVAVERFYKLFGKPVPFVFRSATNEILYMSHLDTVNAMWNKDLIWTAGMYSTCDLFFNALDDKVKDKLFNALMGALKQDAASVKSDAESVLAWATGKTEADVVNAINGGDDSPVGQALANAKSDKSFFYTRNFGAGLIKLMQVVGVEPNAENSKRWADAFGFSSKESAVTGISSTKFETDVGTFLSSVEKMQEVMQLYADVEAREKKKVAERLAEQAAQAAEAI
jgi:hypothetical protein